MCGQNEPVRERNKKAKCMEIQKKIEKMRRRGERKQLLDRERKWERVVWRGNRVEERESERQRQSFCIARLLCTRRHYTTQKLI